MSVRMGLLALLQQRPGYGYQLRAEFDARTGGSWPVNTGQVYATLDRLERDGLVDRSGVDDQGRVRYAISPFGESAVAEWVRAPVLQQTGRDDLAMKLAVLAALPGVRLTEVIQAQRAASMKTLQDLTRTKPSGHVPESVSELAWALVAESLIFAEEAQMRWLDYAEGLIEEALAAGVAAPSAAAPPKRGRPAKASAAARASGR